jgi:hypothetical protein
MVLLGYLPLKYISLRPGEENRFRSVMGAILHTTAYTTIVWLSILHFKFFGESTATSIPLSIVTLFSFILGLMSIFRIFQGAKYMVENEYVGLIRNGLSTIGLMSVYQLLGSQDASASLERWELEWVVGLYTTSHALNVLVNKKEPDAVDCPKEERDKNIAERLHYLVWALLALTLIALSVHLGVYDKDEALFERTGVLSGVFKSGLILVSLHALLEFANWCLVQTKLDKSIIGCLKRDETPYLNLEGCDDAKQELVPLNRSPFYRHVVTSAGVSCLSYVLGRSSGNVVVLFLAVVLYVLTDLAGRGLKHVVG